jgi:DNA topoisomerase-2
MVVGDKMKSIETTWNPAFAKLFDEVISNATDHSKTPEGKHMTAVRVAFDENTGLISVYDNGGIPVVKHSVHKQYIPEMIFGNMHSGSNFDDTIKSTGAGQNGEGSTLVNIFSSKFIVESADGKNEFYQEFTNNMAERTKPKITPSKKKYTKISWYVDKSKLKSDLNDHDNLAKLTKRVYDAAACNPQLKFYLNDKLIEFKRGFNDYIDMHVNGAICTKNDNWEIGFSTSHQGDLEHISFINGTAAPQGGTHIDYIIDQVVTQVREYVKKKTKQDILPGQIKNHFTVFINATVHNPRYDSQTKSCLTTNISDYGTEIKIPDKTIKEIIKSDIMESIMKWAEARAMAEENKKVAEEQKKAGVRDVEKHIEAAGDYPLKKVLHLTEGDSAIGNFVECRNVDLHGGYPLRGKVMNVRGMKASEILKNTECADMMSIIGLTIGESVDKESLNYGFICIMTDADVDGDCISGQLLNFFAMWPELFKQGRIRRLRTPMLIVHQTKNRKDDVWFYNRPDFELWCKQHGRPDPKRVDYIKGLGELEEEDYHRCLNSPVYQVFRLDNDDEAALELAFGSDAAPRKTWLMGV